MIHVRSASIYTRDFRIEYNGEISGLVHNFDTETRADFYLTSLNMIAEEHSALREMPVDLYNNPTVKRRVFTMLQRTLNLVNIQKDSGLWYDWIDFMDSTVGTMESATQVEAAQQKLDSVTEEIMAMQAKKDAGLWTDEDEAYVNSL
jgi:hypothetical protein